MKMIPSNHNFAVFDRISNFFVDKEGVAYDNWTKAPRFNTFEEAIEVVHDVQGDLFIVVLVAAAEG